MSKMARLATSAVQLCQRLQEMYPQKFQFPNKQSEQSSPFRRWTTGSGAGSSYRHHDHRIYSKQMSEGSASVSANNNTSCGGVARWSLGLEQLLADPPGAAAFAHFLSKEFAAENIRFWWSCEQYRCCEEDEKRSNLAAEIWQRHLAEGASEPVNVDAAARRAAALRLHQQPPPQDLFAQAQKQIFNVMKFDSYPRFLRSSVHAECARADLRGLPPPYATDANKGLESHSDGNGGGVRLQLKKSASNASERRRSGSLLPWKARAASRDRAAPAADAPPDAPPPAPAPPLTDVVKSSQTGDGQCSLCRVVLPDGATSVVGVDDAVTVRRLVDRLLARRNLACGAYDVLLREGAVDGGAPSSALGGREARVERRVVLRVALGARAVAVRCRPARRLRHVLRPVLQRYAAPGAPRAALLAGAPLHPDTPVHELDGARIRIVELSPAAPHHALALDAPDDDADSLSDVALRLHDDDDAPPDGRVRAALRAGAALQHHPPDFLENLRETQRQRLQPRTPPPLPPKPAQRAAPTVV